MTKELLAVQNLSKYYSGTNSVVMGLSQINLSFRQGEFVAITGESGSGKSTLAQVLGGILPYENGELLWKGQPTSHYDGADWEAYRRNHISYISQSYGIMPGCTVLENVVSALRLSGMEQAEAGEKARQILKQVELWQFRNRKGARLSSGQKQRLSIARALAKPAPVLIADEPTGNLDAENSAMVIRLLAEAAKERLVILITHEFSEAEAVVTRHIQLQDGRVVMDMPQRKEEPAFVDTSDAPFWEDSCGKLPGKSHQVLSAYIARIQMKARPVWCLWMTVFFALTVFAVFAFAGTFLVSWDDTSTRIYDNSAFRNGDETRIVISHSDGSDMTDEDISRIMSLAHVSYLEPYGYVTDINYAYREDVDFRYHYSVSGGGESQATTVESVSFLDTPLYLSTIPVLPEGETFLTEGRLPEDFYEVVAADPALLGQTIRVYLQDRQNWSISYSIAMDVTVVGVTDWGSGLYFYQDVGRMFTGMFQWTNVMYAPSSEVESGTFLCESTLYQRWKGMKVPMPCGSDPEESREMLCAGDSQCKLQRYFQVSYEDFDAMVGDGYGDQVSLFLTDYAYTDRVLDQLHDMGYAALSPFRESSTTQDAALAKQRIQTLKVCAIAFVAVILLQVVVLRAMFGVETENYQVLAQMGLNRRAAGGSVLWQVLAFVLAGQILGVGAILMAGHQGVNRIAQLLPYLSWEKRLALLALHLAVSFLGAMWIRRSLQKQIYPYAGTPADLDMTATDREEKASDDIR